MTKSKFHKFEAFLVDSNEIEGFAACICRRVILLDSRAHCRGLFGWYRSGRARCSQRPESKSIQDLHRRFIPHGWCGIELQDHQICRLGNR
jgi:hypothetical protein